MRFVNETVSYGGDMTWLGSAHGTDNARTSTLVVSNFTAATHYPNGYLPAGTPVNAADERAVKPWTGAASEKLGFVLFDQSVKAGDDKIAVPVLRHGIIRSHAVPGDFTAPASAPGFVFVGSDYSENKVG